MSAYDMKASRHHRIGKGHFFTARRENRMLGLPLILAKNGRVRLIPLNGSRS